LPQVFKVSQEPPESSALNPKPIIISSSFGRAYLVMTIHVEYLEMTENRHPPRYDFALIVYRWTTSIFAMFRMTLFLRF
jgi:hypothetical protein